MRISLSTKLPGRGDRKDALHGFQFSATIREENTSIALCISLFNEKGVCGPASLFFIFSEKC